MLLMHCLAKSNVIVTTPHSLAFNANFFSEEKRNFYEKHVIVVENCSEVDLELGSFRRHYK